jgi:hypothetical protein
VRHHLGKLEPCFAQDPTLREPAQLGMAHGESGPAAHGRRDNIAEVLIAPCPFEGHHGLHEAVDRLPIIALRLVGKAEALVRHRLLDDLPVSCGECPGALGSSNRLIRRADEVVMA